MGSKSNHAHYSSTRTLPLFLSLINIVAFCLLFTVPSSVVAQPPSVAIGIANEGLFVYVLSVAVTAGPTSNILHTSTSTSLNTVPADHPAAASTCSGILPDIRACQTQGVKVFISLKWTSSSSSPPSNAQQVSDFIWNTFLGGHSISRPFGDVVFDGIIFEIDDIFGGSSGAQFWTNVATSLRTRTSEKRLYLSAAVPCLLSPDAHFQSTGLFDFVWVRFYNNRECEFGANANALLAAWNKWTTFLTSGRIFLGLPAAPGAALSGYIPPDVLKATVLPFIKTSPRYGGVMLWNTFFDQQTGYTAAIINSV